MVLTVRQDSKPSNHPLWRDGVQPLNLPSLDSPIEVDVAIIGGGFSGLWSAFHLLERNPSLSIAIFEAEEIGFGASGRNGGWVSSDYPVDPVTLKERHPKADIEKFWDAMRSCVDEIGDFASTHSPEAKFRKAGSLIFARNRAQLQRIKGSLFGKKRLLGPNETQSMLKVDGAIGSLFDPDCATIAPYPLVIALAKHLLSRGVLIFERSEAKIDREICQVNGYRVTSRQRVIATEAYKRPSRRQIPIYSLMMATSPLTAEERGMVTDVAGLAFMEALHNVNYAQMTADGRIAIGGRGARYPYGSRLRSSKENKESVHSQISDLLEKWFPQLGQWSVTHRWGGPVAVRWNWESYLFFDPLTQTGSIGGYVGDGVTMSYLSAKALADRMLGGEKYIDMPFFENRSRKWPIEPLRFLGANALVSLVKVADHEERFTGRESLIYKGASLLIGK
ncbi:MAG: NAD(P)/FAD-dependent oxidoreductase [Candidatus Nanopelagicaceae bacterium]